MIDWQTITFFCEVVIFYLLFPSYRLNNLIVLSRRDTHRDKCSEAERILCRDALIRYVLHKPTSIQSSSLILLWNQHYHMLVEHISPVLDKRLHTECHDERVVIQGDWRCNSPSTEVAEKLQQIVNCTKSMPFYLRFPIDRELLRDFRQQQERRGLRE